MEHRPSTTPDEVAAEEVAAEEGLSELLVEMKALHADRARDQAGVERLKRETDALHAQGAALKVRTRELLATLTRAA